VSVSTVKFPEKVPIVPEMVDAVVAPMVVPLIDPPVTDTAFEFWVDIVPRPVMEVLGMVLDAVKAEVPLPMT
jgi:hypothetical protein